MSKEAKKEAKAQRAAEIATARNKNPSMVAIKCVFPPCTTNVMVKAPPEGVAVGTPQHMMKLGGIPMCPKHGEYLAFYIWAAINIKLQPQQTASGLVLPGNPNYNATVKEQPLTKEQIINILTGAITTNMSYPKGLTWNGAADEIMKVAKAHYEAEIREMVKNLRMILGEPKHSIYDDPGFIFYYEIDSDKLREWESRYIEEE